MTLHVVTADGDHYVCHDGAPIAGPFPSNAAAWRALDRLSLEPLSPAEDRADWIASKIIEGDQ